MFTGIIEELGKIRTITSKNIEICSSYITNDIKLGDSVAVNGACLTVTKFNNDGFCADVSPETINVTTFSKLKAGSFVNLERALSANGRFGGHILSGHIDGRARCVNIVKSDDFYSIEFELEKENSKYVVKKGSIAIDGISLTVAELKNNTVRVAVIPHTYENTNLKYLKIGDYVNIETDIIARYIEKFLSTGDNRTGISMEFLLENGF